MAVTPTEDLDDSEPDMEEVVQLEKDLFENMIKDQLATTKTQCDAKEGEDLRRDGEFSGALRKRTTGPTTEDEPQTEACDDMTSWPKVDQKRTEFKTEEHSDTPTSMAEQIAELRLAGYPGIEDAAETTRQVEVAVAGSIPRDQNHQFEARISVAWELLQCIQEELGQEPYLSRVLTVTTERPSHAWAVSCGEYVKSTWGGPGMMFLDSLEKALLGIQPDSPGTYVNPVSFPELTLMTLGQRCNFALCSIEDEINGLPASVTFKGTSPEISALGQFLSWIAATFRLPHHGKLSTSVVDFVDDPIANENTMTKAFRICMRNLASVIDDASLPGCWHSLFPSTTMASGFQVPQHSSAIGLRVSFDAMLELAGILYYVDLREAGESDYGIYFRGMSSILYPTDYFVDTNTVQWHLVTNTESAGLGRDCSPNDISGSRWVRIADLETLRCAVAILGYCGEAAILLGTEGRKTQYPRFRYSRSSFENPPPEASIGTVTAGIGVLGFGTAQATGTLKYRKGLADAMSLAQDITYQEILNYAENDPVIIFETEPGNERAWLVPRLSVILDLLNYWAGQNRDTDAAILYALALPDGGRASKEVLREREYAKTVLIRPTLDDTGVRVGEIVKRLYGQMQRREEACAKSERGAQGTAEFGRYSLLGWDLRELVEPPVVVRRRWINPHVTDVSPNIAVTPCWLPLTRVIPVYFGQGLGELITPVRPDDVCELWRPIPGGFLNNFLVASVRCIVATSKRSGYDDCCVIFDDLVWDYTDESVFAKCGRCVANQHRCRKKL